MGKRILLSFILLFSCSTTSNAIAMEDYLLSVDMSRIDQWSNSDSKLLPDSARLTQVRYRIPRSNPDNLVGQIVLDYPLRDKQQLYNSKWNIGLWIYGPGLKCSTNNSCDGGM